MNFIKTPVKGMCDFLPADMRLRERVLGMIKEVYAKYGFMQIETPAVEHIENLTGKQGGDNEKLIFKILKRGDELKRALMEQSGELADSGLRYDLTVPLARYYANNSNNLPSPFKALQIGSVWRADRPQKGRFRQFTQCDIDILGDGTPLAEIELISATSDMLSRIFALAKITEFTVHISDRRILKAMAGYAGFDARDYDTVFIILDKVDKIGFDGARRELAEAGFCSEAVEKFIALIANAREGISCAEFCSSLGDAADMSVANAIDDIIRCAGATAAKGVKLIFDPTLVRGMSYYTGTIFECSIDGYGFSIAGGGRYDEMIGKFSGQQVSACGFSIGFERIITILKEHTGELECSNTENYAILIESGVCAERIVDVLKRARELREDGSRVTIQPLKKNAKRQIDLLKAEGYSNIERIYRD